MRQEPHRVYWQQWIVTSSSKTLEKKRELVTKSAAVRISDAARAVDVTLLLRNNMAPSLLNDTNDTSQQQDALVLVATLYNAPSIQFEHEVNVSVGTADTSNGDTDYSIDTPLSSSSEPLHICKTLRGEENPLTVRDALLQHLKQRQSQSTISPKLQWFYVPSSPNMPNCIELDGYCTGDESEELDDDDDDQSGSDDGVDCEETLVDCSPDGDKQEHWWQNSGNNSLDTTTAHDNKRTQSPRSKLIQKQERRWNQLRSIQSTASHDARHVVSGYLLKRSRHDKHVWKRVHCVLTDTHFWVVSRLYNVGSDNNTKIAKHLCISLNEAMLISPVTSTTTATIDYPAPFSFSVVSKNGISHTFRASSTQIQKQWMTCLKRLIAHAQDNDLMQHAELICENEAYAHNKRRMAIAVEPLMNGDKDDARAKSILTWGMDVAAYREACRQVQSRLPTKRIVVSTENGHATTAAAAATPRQLFASPANGKVDEDNELNSDTRELITSTWDLAAVLLARATLYCQGSNALETLCRHVDYVITGRFRDSAKVGIHSSSVMDRRNDPPPMDLFDALLSELQSGCCSANTEEKKTNGHVIETPLGK